MGHYCGDMCCPICGEMKCICTTSKLSAVKWLINDETNYEIITTSEYDKRYSVIETRFGKIHVSAMFRRAGMKLYDTKEEAIADLPAVIQANINALTNQIETLTNMLSAQKQKLKDITG
jgi:hypothetical protein